MGGLRASSVPDSAGARQLEAPHLEKRVTKTTVRHDWLAFILPDQGKTFPYFLYINCTNDISSVVLNRLHWLRFYINTDAYIAHIINCRCMIF